MAKKTKTTETPATGDPFEPKSENVLSSMDFATPTAGNKNKRKAKSPSEVVYLLLGRTSQDSTETLLSVRKTKGQMKRFVTEAGEFIRSRYPILKVYRSVDRSDFFDF